MLKIGVKQDEDRSKIDKIKWDNVLIELEQRGETKHKNKNTKKKKKCLKMTDHYSNPDLKINLNDNLINDSKENESNTDIADLSTQNSSNSASKIENEKIE